jgi:hypothetical protein
MEVADLTGQKCMSCGTDTYMDHALLVTCRCCGKSDFVCSFCGNNTIPIYWQRVPKFQIINSMVNPIGMSKRFCES